MREAVGNLWDYVKPCAVIGISGNGRTNSAGHAVMGRGCAREARDRFPGIDKRLGMMINRHGSRCFRFLMRDYETESAWTLVSIPVKYDWREPADLLLIAQSCEQLSEMADKFAWSEVITVRLGCGLGALTWDIVQPIMADWLDDRFLILTPQA